jgi:hypothetical protein
LGFRHIAQLTKLACWKLRKVRKTAQCLEVAAYQRSRVARHELAPEAAISKLDRYDLPILDDYRYVLFR